MNIQFFIIESQYLQFSYNHPVPCKKYSKRVITNSEALILHKSKVSKRKKKKTSISNEKILHDEFQNHMRPSSHR